LRDARGDRKIAWQTIHSRAPLVIREDTGRRARDYQEIEVKLKAGVDFEHAWSDFLHAFYAYKTASFFAYPSPPSLSVEWQALLAGAAEWLSAEFGLPHPKWTDQPQYFLSEPWDPTQELGIGMSRHIPDKLARSPEAFRRRNIAFLSRNLIAL
jgi:hypothetical protein